MLADMLNAGIVAQLFRFHACCLGSAAEGKSRIRSHRCHWGLVRCFTMAAIAVFVFVVAATSLHNW